MLKLIVSAIAMGIGLMAVAGKATPLKSAADTKSCACCTDCKCENCGGCCCCCE